MRGLFLKYNMNLNYSLISNRILPMKKEITIAVLVVAAVGFIGYSQYKTFRYKKNLKEFREQSLTSIARSRYICEDLRKVWYGYIFDDEKYFDSSSGEFYKRSYYGDDCEYCSNFSEAVHKKIEWFEAKLPNDIDQPYYIARTLYKKITPPPSKYKEAHIYVKQMFKAMERLHELSESPKGNLSSYIDNCNECMDDFSSAMQDLTIETGIDFN